MPEHRRKVRFEEGEEDTDNFRNDLELVMCFHKPQIFLCQPRCIDVDDKRVEETVTVYNFSKGGVVCSGLSVIRTIYYRGGSESYARSCSYQIELFGEDFLKSKKGITIGKTIDTLVAKYSKPNSNGEQ